MGKQRNKSKNKIYSNEDNRTRRETDLGFGMPKVERNDVIMDQAVLEVARRLYSQLVDHFCFSVLQIAVASNECLIGRY